MPHKLQPIPKWIQENRPNEQWFNKICDFHYFGAENVSPGSHFDHCERQAVIWLYHTEIWGFCQTCYDWCYPAPSEWYRVVKIGEDFHGRL